MKKREEIILLWFEMWLKKADMGITDIFDDNVIYTESWGPEYHGVNKVKLWFNECITRQDVIKWETRQFFHKDDQTIAQWYFRYQNAGEPVKEFDGVSLIKWTSGNKILTLQEFGCNSQRYDPYKDGDTPLLKNESVMWF